MAGRGGPIRVTAVTVARVMLCRDPLWVCREVQSPLGQESSRLRIFPVLVMGRASMNWTTLGYL